MKRYGTAFALAVLVCTANPAAAQKVQPLNFGDFEQWQVREIKESAILGGETKYVYAVAPNDTVRGPVPYKPKRSPWGTSNVLAIVSGITKTSNTVFPEAREGGGRCARLETMLVKCKVLGIVNISVLASGSIFLGNTVEPIRSASNPYSKINMGVPYKGRPKALQLDYKAEIDSKGEITKATGMSVRTHKGKDRAEVFVLLQNRSEDADGNVRTKRVGSGSIMIGESTDGWVNGCRIPIRYGDISGTEDYTDAVRLSDTYYCQNSKGEMVPIRESGWAAEDEPVTHLVVMLSSGSLGAYSGALGNTLHVDNVELIF